MYYNRDYREKLIKWKVSFLFISNKIQIWNVLALFVGKKLVFPPLLKKRPEFYLKIFYSSGGGYCAEAPGSTQMRFL